MLTPKKTEEAAFLTAISGAVNDAMAQAVPMITQAGKEKPSEEEIRSQTSHLIAQLLVIEGPPPSQFPAKLMWHLGALCKKLHLDLPNPAAMKLIERLDGLFNSATKENPT